MASSSPAPKVRPRKRVRLLYEHRVNLYCFLVALPGLLVSIVLVWMQPWALESRLALIALELFVWWLLALALQEQTTRPLQTLSNVIGALREEDYSFRARNAVAEDALGELSLEVNALADMLSDEKIRAIEATALLQRVVDEIDAPLFAFDPASVLRLVNPAGEHLLRQSKSRMLGRSAAELKLQKCLTGGNESLVELDLDLNLNDSQARWLLRRSSFRQNGVPHTLIVLSDVSRALREEERRAWQRLIRVLGHELSNSLAPIKSIAGSLNSRISATAMDPEVRNDVQHGLEIIEARSASLHRFLEAYRRLAQMPAPVLREVELPKLVARVATLETRIRVCVHKGPDLVFIADPDQLEQMLINLVRNAADAVLELSSAAVAMEPCTQAVDSDSEVDMKVRVRWDVNESDVNLLIEDNGPGLLNPANVFTPFYTTKPSGSGVGLVLSRQIAEAHGGRIEISNRNGARGCLVKVVLPLTPHQQR